MKMNTYESDAKQMIHLITKPFFLLSAMDVPFFGPNVIMIDHCYD
jgi:predicted alpha/beta-fold hydrolase